MIRVKNRCTLIATNPFRSVYLNRTYSTTSTAVKPSLARKFTYSVVGATTLTYSLAILGAYHDESIRNVVTEFLPGAVISLNGLDKALEWFKVNVSPSLSRVDTSKVSDAWEKTRNTVSEWKNKVPDVKDVYHRTKDAVNSISNPDKKAQERANALIEISKHSSDIEHTLQPLLPGHQDATLNNRMAALVKELSTIIKELANNTPENAPPNLIKAKTCLVSLLNNINVIQEDKESAIFKATKVEKERLKQKLEAEALEIKHHHEKAIKALEKEKKQEIELFTEKVKSDYDQQVVAKLQQQALDFASQLKTELDNQSKELEVRFRREISHEMDKERSQRLAKLEVLMLRLKSLEQLTVRNNTLLSRSLAIHQLTAFVDIIKMNLGSGEKKSLHRELSAVKHLGPYFPLLAEVANSIPEEIASQGIESLPSLKIQFHHISSQIQKASLFPDNGGLLSYLLSWTFSHIMFQQSDLVEGQTPQDILSRVHYYLDCNDLDHATRELNGLKGWPRILAQDWIKAARQHLEMMQAFEVAKTYTSLLNMGVL